MLGVVILNYCNYKCTIDCVHSLMDHNTEKTEICIVDNGSDNDSCLVLQREFAGYEHVHVLFSRENLGFANGNNLGIDFLRNKSCEDILIINSDILFEDDNVLSELLRCKGTNVGIISPIVFNRSKGEINYVFIRKKKHFRLMMAAELLYTILTKTLCLPVKMKGKPSGQEAVPERAAQSGVYAFSGCFFLLTEEFFRHYPGLYPKTYLFYEEWATAVYLHFAHLDTKVVDAGTVVHLGAASTDTDMASKKRHYERQSAQRILKLLLRKDVTNG